MSVLIISGNESENQLSFMYFLSITLDSSSKLNLREASCVRLLSYKNEPHGFSVNIFLILDFFYFHQ